MLPPNASGPVLDDPIPVDEVSILPVAIACAKPVEDVKNTDDMIRQRLLTLKEDRLNSPAGGATTTDESIAIRIANLKGVDYKPSAGRDASLLLATDERTDEEKVRDLVGQFMAETNLDEAVDPVKDIERRLAALKATSVDGTGEKQQPLQEQDDDDDDAKVMKLVAMYLAEAELPENKTQPGPVLSAEEKEFLSDMVVTKEQEELPWCTICNVDADLRYQGDLFCKQCYKEIKDDE